MTLYSAHVTRVEVDVDGTWVDITGSSVSLSISRADGDVGALSASLADASLDPTISSTLRFGRPVRVSAAQGASWVPIYTGQLLNVEVVHKPLSRSKVDITLTAQDNVAVLAAQSEARGVGTIDGLRWLLSGVGVPFLVNGSSATLSAQTIVATNDGASLWDQVLIARDSNLGFAWVDQLNRLVVQDVAHFSQVSKASYDQTVYGADFELDFNSEQLINAVTVNFQRYDIGNETTTEVPYGPYRDEASIAEWGAYSATFSLQGVTEEATTIEAYANQVLARNATGQIRCRSITVPITSTERVQYALRDVNDVVTVTNPDGTNALLRIISVEHAVSPTKWTVTYGFDLPLSLNVPTQKPGTGYSVIPPNSVGTPQLVPGSVDPDVLAPAVNQSIADALQAAADAHDFAATKNQVYYQATKPTAGSDGDTWFDTDDGNHIYVYSASANDYVDAKDTGIAAALSQASAAAAAAASAASAASTAQAAANTAQSTANGKNRVTYSTSAPVNGSSAGVVGDIWFVRNATSGSVTAHYECTATNTWAKRTLNGATLDDLDAGSITTGFLDVANRLAANSITVEKLLVGTGANVIANAGFESGTAPHTAAARVLSWTASTVAPRSGQYAARVVLSGTGGAATLAIGGAFNVPSKMTPTHLGDSWHGEAWVRWGATQSTTAQLSIYEYNANGDYLNNTASAAPTALTGSYQRITADLTITNAATAYVIMSVKVGGDVANDVLWIDDVSLVKKVEGSLIVDGAIDGKTITGALFQSSASVNRGVKFSNTGLAAWDSSGNSTFTIDATTGAVVMKGSLTAGSDVSGATVTGGVVQTSTAANRGVKLNSTGFTAYNASGASTFNIDAATGAVLMLGTLVAGSVVSTGSLTVGALGDELVRGGNFLDDLADNGWILGGGTAAYQSYNVNYPGGRALILSSANGVYGSARSPLFPVTAGQTYGLSVDASWTTTIPNGLLYRVNYYDGNKASLSYSQQSFQAVTGTSPASNQFGQSSTKMWTLTWAWTAPSTARWASVEFFNYPANTAATNSFILLGHASCRKQIDGNLIVDGAIDGKVITGAVLQTAKSGNRMTLQADGSGGVLNYWSGIAGETGPGSINPNVDASGSPNVAITAPTNASYTVSAQLSINSGYGSGTVDVTSCRSVNLHNSPIALLGSNSVTNCTISPSGNVETNGKITSYGGYADTTTASANAYWASDSHLARSSSSIRSAKLDIESLSADDVRAILDVPASTWFDRGDAERYAAYLSGDESVGLGDILHPLTRIPGVIAEDVAAAGLEVLVTRDDAGALQGVAYDRIGPLLIPLIKELYAEVADLTTRLAVLEGAA